MSEILYSDDGQALGHLTEAEDGALILLDFDGETILSAATPDGEALDPADYAMSDDTDEYLTPDEAMQMYAEQQAQLAAQWEQSQPPTVAAGIDWEELGHQKAALAHQLGRPLTNAEQRAVAVNVERQLNQGSLPDFGSALEVAWDTGQAKPIDLDNRADRVQAMTEWAANNERHARGEDTTEAPAPSREDYDMDNHADRVAWQVDRLNGALDDETAHAVAYNGSDDFE